MNEAIRDLARLFVALAAAPLLHLVRLFQRLRTGPRAILELRIGHERLSLAEREALLGSLRRAGRDDAVVAVLLHIEGAVGGWGAVHDLAAELERLRRGGTQVVSVLESADNAALTLASSSDRVFMVPSGEVSAGGIAATLTFFGGLFEQLGMVPDFESAGEYKSLAEPFSRTFASHQNREAVQALVADLHTSLVSTVASGRGLAPAAVADALSDAPLGAEEARERGLVDSLAYEDEVLEWLEDTFGENVPVRSLEAWSRRERWVERLEEAGRGGRAIAVIHLEGPVVREPASRGTSVSARAVVPILRDLLEDEEVAAVVLHVDSPGGSALASDLIWREVSRLAKKKPLVASFESVAASGGYYLAAPAHHIVARPVTITGSIGVVGGKVVVGEALRRLGVFTEHVSSTESSTLLSPSARFTEHQRARFRSSLQRTYDGFVERVAAGRGVSVEDVEPRCRGRVWSGRAAREAGLVDTSGGLREACDRARELAGLLPGSRELHLAPRVPRTWARELLRSVVGSTPLPMTRLQCSPAWILLTHPHEPLALCPWTTDPSDVEVW